jgi:hypothetical protein
MSSRAKETTMAPQTIIRQATSADDFALRRLAHLDDRPALHGDVLLAEQAGEIRAAMSMGDGRTIANPFAPTLGLVETLRAHSHYVETIAA